MSTKATFMPDILAARPGYSAISVHRALRHVKATILELEPEGERATETQAALDDLEMMLMAGASGRPLGEEVQ